MRKRSRFLVSAVYLAAVNIFLRSVAVSFNAYVSAKIGAESMGLLTLVMSVYGMAVTLATSGVNLAAVRLTAERSAYLSDARADAAAYKKGVVSVVRSCIAYSLIFSLSTGTLMYIFSPLIGKYLLCDSRTVLSLRVLSVSLIPISLTSALSGCFTGLRKVYKNAVSAMLEQGTKIILTSTALALSIPQMTDRVEYACLAVVGGAAVSEGASLVINAVMLLLDNKRPAGTRAGDSFSRHRKTRLSDVAEVSLPVAVGAYARQGLSTAEHLAIPWGMKKSGMDSASALASYGVLHGMVFPLILFPSAVLSSAAGLLVPELAELRALGKRDSIEALSHKALEAAVLFSVGCAGVFLCFSHELGMSVYNSAEAGRMILATAPLVPVMYLDMTVDCMLKGLGEQLHSMRINIIDSASSLALVLLLVPSFRIVGYVISVYFCECLNCFLSLRRLNKITGVGDAVVPFFVRSAAFAALSFAVLRGATYYFDLPVSASIAVFAALYLSLSVIFSKLGVKRQKTKANMKNNVEIGARG